MNTAVVINVNESFNKVKNAREYGIFMRTCKFTKININTKLKQR